MATVKTMLHCEVDPHNPVMEILAVADALIKYNGVPNAGAILLGVAEGLDKRMELMSKQKGAEANGEPVPGPGRIGADQE